MAKKFLSLTLTFVFVLSGCTFFNTQNQNTNTGREIFNFEECVAAGNRVMESYPRQCNAEGKNFNEDIGNELEKAELIKVESPRPNQVMTSPYTIQGEARGYWYFEASFPGRLEDANGNIVSEFFIMATSEWMTENFVPFQKVLEFEKPTTKTGNLILMKDNPSGLPENDDQLRIPVKFE